MYPSSAVLINGCHLQASLKNESWNEIVFGGDNEVSLRGRAVAGVRTAITMSAHRLILGTGASQADGLKEAEYTLRELVRRKEAISRHLNFTEAQAQKLDMLLATAHIDEESTNTREEVANALTVCSEENLDSLIIVTSPWHIARAHLYGLMRAQELRDAQGTDIDVYAVGAHGSTQGVHISEPPHRADRPTCPIHDLVKQADRLGRNQEHGEAFYQAFEQFLAEWN